MSRHVPVMVEEVLEYLAPRPGGIYVDCTIGEGGHALAIGQRMKGEGILLGLDRDAAAVSRARGTLENLTIDTHVVKENFTDLPEVLASLAIERVDGLLFDLGMSSVQLASAGRGFSYREDGPLDMRMDRDQRESAADLVNNMPKAELASLIKRYGEEPWAERIAEFIVTRREAKPIETTGQLVQTIKDALPAAVRRKGGHPARRTFQALRIAVNDELENLKKALAYLTDVVTHEGRAVFISFHSLEDRLVKRHFRQLASDCVCPPDFPKCACDKQVEARILTPKPVRPSEEEIQNNPRARSAKLRAAEILPAEESVLNGKGGE